MMKRDVAMTRRTSTSDDEERGIAGVLGRVADFTIGTAVVLWHAALSGRERRRRAPVIRTYSSTR